MNTSTTKKRLIQITIQKASKIGLDNISLSLIAKELGITKSSIFSHFKNKEDLIEQVYKYGKSLTAQKNQRFSFEEDAEIVLTKAVDYWHSIYSEHSDFNRIIEMQKFIDSRAKEISQSLEAMIYSQSQVIIEILVETGRLDIDELDLAIESFASTITKYLKAELLDARENTQWKEDRFIHRFCSHYKIKKDSR